MFISKRRTCYGLALLMGLALSAQAQIYDFESLTVHSFIHGHDNWRDQPGQGQGIIAQDTTPTNGTWVASVLPTVAFNEPAYLTRVNDANFSFPAFTGGETAAVVQFDATGDHIALFALGHDLTGDGMLRTADGEVGPAFGTWDRNFRIQGANGGPAVDIPFGSGDAGHDWYRLRLVIDFTALGGDGQATLLYRNLSDGDLVFEPVAGLEAVNLQLTGMAPEAPPGSWDALWLHLMRGGGNEPLVDHLMIGLGSPSGVEITGTESRLRLSAPNPIQGATTLLFTLPRPAHVELDLVDLQGRRVRQLFGGAVAEEQRVTWDGGDRTGQRLAPGVYFYLLNAGEERLVRRVTLLK